MKISVIVPTNNPAQLASFNLSWSSLFKKHGVHQFTVLDGKQIRIYHKDHRTGSESELKFDRRFRGLIFNRNSGVRNIGFVEALKIGSDVLMTFDDDTAPSNNDPIHQHLEVLNKRYPIDWFNPFDGAYTRGFPYGVRTEARCSVSHGIWSGVQDFDAPTTLVRGIQPVRNQYTGPLPRGCLMPVCGMNLAWTRDVTDTMYYAPMGGKTGFDRFDDIWMGIALKRTLDARGQCMYHGKSMVEHQRQSNVFKNLEMESAGIRENETYYQNWVPSEYRKLHNSCLSKWGDLVRKLI